MTTSSFVIKILLAITLASMIGGCATREIDSQPSSSKKYPATQRPYKINGKTYYPINSARGYRESGTASWYGKKFHGRKTANGETYNMYAKTAAHKTLPMNTMVLVRNIENGRETVVRINDRGPFSRGRIIDLSLTAAKEIDMVRKGTVRTEIVTLGESTSSDSNRDRLKYQDFDSGDFYIQVGAFLDKNNAINLARLFTSTGMKVTIQPYLSNNKTYHRVQVYAGTSLMLARQFEQQILGRGYSGSFIIAR